MTPHIVWTDLGDARMSADLPLSEIGPQGEILLGERRILKTSRVILTGSSRQAAI